MLFKRTMYEIHISKQIEIDVILDFVSSKCISYSPKGKKSRKCFRHCLCLRAFPCLKDPPVLSWRPLPHLLSIPSHSRLIHSNSHGCQEVLGDFLFAFILFQGHRAVLSCTHSCTFPGRGADTVVRIALYSDSLNRHKLLKSTSHQLRILLHMLKFPSKPLLLPGLWRHSLPTV